MDIRFTAQSKGSGPRSHYASWIAAALCLFCLVPALDAQAVPRSSLSRWLSNTAIPGFLEQATAHPRYLGGTLRIASAGGNALEEAIATVVQQEVSASHNIALLQRYAPDARPPATATTIDALDCSDQPGYEHELLVTVRTLEQRATEVELSLRDSREPDIVLQVWLWHGRLSADEYRYASREPAMAGNRGSLQRPWASDQADYAAHHLARQLVCQLRPHISDHLRLSWPAGAAGLQVPFAGILHDLRGRLVAYREISDSDTGGDYRFEVKLQPVTERVWQLWLSGASTTPGGAPVQALTYLRADQFQPPLAVARVTPAPVPLSLPGDGDPASKYLTVELLDASQSDRYFSGADLQVRLRLRNRSSQPLVYALSLSGGHYQHCVPEPAYYRHDRYGYLEGRLDPGQQQVRLMKIEGARHQPNPLFGMRRCAGFSGLEGFEDFATQGHKVTQYVHWGL